MKQKLSLTGILIKNIEEKGYTAVLAEFPEVVAEGNTQEEAERNLIAALMTMLEFKKEEFMNDMNSANDDNIITRPLELELA